MTVISVTAITAIISVEFFSRSKTPVIRSAVAMSEERRPWLLYRGRVRVQQLAEQALQIYYRGSGCIRVLMMEP
jgi:hypothetical protein